MLQIICPLTYIPIRKEASHQSEQISQLLYGETATVIEDNSQWLNIICNYDNYRGWIEKKVVKYRSEKSVENTIINAFARLVGLDGNSLWLSTGSEIDSELFDSSSSTIVTINPDLNVSSVEELALQFLGTPYLWGGRSFMGVDCSGFIQVVFKAINIKLPRDASQQVMLGSVVEFPSEAKSGDLAFFDNEEGKITHVGLILDSGRIIHASGSVRIDNFDHQGIYVTQSASYSHRLRIIKRVIF